MAGGLRLSASGFRHVDPQVSHLVSHWQVRAPDGAYELNAVVDVASRDELSAIEIPATALRPGTRYLWRVSYVTSAGVIAKSDEVELTTGDYPIELVPIELASHFNRDVVAEPGDERYDLFDGVYGALIADGFDGTSSPNPASKASGQ